jgi:hypothetical protein
VCTVKRERESFILESRNVIVNGGVSSAIGVSVIHWSVVVDILCIDIGS